MIVSINSIEESTCPFVFPYFTLPILMKLHNCSIQPEEMHEVRKCWSVTHQERHYERVFAVST